MTSSIDVSVERFERNPRHRLSLMDEIFVEAG